MLSNYTRSTFSAPTAAGYSIEHDIYIRGDQPATVVVIQELPGIGPETVQLARTLHRHGFRVVLPHLFGPLGKLRPWRNLARVMCMRKEFRILTSHQSSPIVDWLRALCRNLQSDHEDAKVGVIGMCLTGNFAISLMADNSVLAGVASQPSLPLFRHSDLHMAESDITEVRSRLDSEGPMIALRFEGDTICTAEKFEALDRAFNDDAQRIQLTTLPGDGHSVLTRDLISGGEPAQQALNDIISYFSARLKTEERESHE